jgi:hypothetical protein
MAQREYEGLLRNGCFFNSFKKMRHKYCVYVLLCAWVLVTVESQSKRPAPRCSSPTYVCGSTMVLLVQLSAYIGVEFLTL